MQRYLHAQSAGAIVLLAAAFVALVWVNSPLAELYRATFETPVRIVVAGLGLELEIRDAVVEGLMALFFLMVALEIKREVVEGELVGLQRAALPVAAAVGGVVLPAAIYVAMVLMLGGPLGGWAIAISTDVAFSLGVLALLGSRVPGEVWVLLLAVTVVDDLIGIVVIAVVFTDDLAVAPLVAAVVLLAALVLAFRVGLRNPVPYALIGIALWAATFLSGVHATIAGVAVGFAAPVHARRPREEAAAALGDAARRLEESLERGDADESERLMGQLDELASATESPLDRLERLLRPWVSFLVLPVFALAAAGVEVTPTALSNALDGGVMLGIIGGLLVGKPVGIVAAVLISRRAGLGKLPPNVGLRHVVGLALLSGIGFTVSLFLAGLALADQELAAAKIGVLAASAIAAPVGYAWLRWGARGSPGRDDHA